MRTTTLIKISAALLTFMTLSQCLDGDYRRYQDDVERSQGYDPTGVSTRADQRSTQDVIVQYPPAM